MSAGRHQAQLATGTWRLREAGPGDARLLWAWANDPQVRALAFDSRAIPWETHAAWYTAKLADPACCIGVLETTNGSPVGQIRFDERPEGLEVDLSVSPVQRGQGFGQILLREGLAMAVKRWPHGTLVVANVLMHNTRSIRLFERCGFRAHGTGSQRGKAFCRLERTLR